MPAADRACYSTSDEDVLQLAHWALAIEEHYSKRRDVDTPMDIEWAKDSRTGQLFIVQARPETVHCQKRGAALRLYHLRENGTPLVEGLAVGGAIAASPARTIRHPREMDQFQPGEVLITQISNPNWEPIMKQAAAIVAERGGRTSHAAIVARELGIAAIVGASGAIDAIATGRPITISCAEGEVGQVIDLNATIEKQE